MKSQIVTSSGHGGRRYLPYVFTEQGIAMLSSVLRSETAVQVSIQIMQAFVSMRRLLANNLLLARLETLEKQQLAHEYKTDERFEKVFNALEDRSAMPKQGIFIDGQVFDAYVFVSDLIKSAKRSIVLIDNYVDESVLTLFSKNAHDIRVTILTRNITKTLKLDVEKYNAQYSKIELKPFADAHDRFLIIDDDTIYHLGASLKDLGKKRFAFSKFEKEAFRVLEALEGMR